jgi:hypothetical protein
MTISMTLNENSNWYWHDPKVTNDIQFSIPLPLVDGKTVGKMLTDAIDDMVHGWAEAYGKWVKEEAEKKAEEDKKAEEENKTE